MATKFSYFGFKKEIFCDRCNQLINSNWGYNLCDDCFDIPTDRIRRSELEHIYLDKNKKEIKCSYCGNLHSRLPKKDICFRCLSNHYEHKHTGFDSNPPSVGSSRVNHCSTCGGSQLVTKLAEKKFSYKYFRVGQRNHQESPFDCTGYNVFSVRVARYAHEWLNIHSTVVSQKEAAEAIKNGAYVFNLMGFDSQEIEYIATGSTVFWCWKCGNFYDLIPRFHKRLPATGRELLPR